MRLLLRINKTIVSFFFCMCWGLCLSPQTIERFNSFSYSVNEGLLQTTLADMAFDKNNFCWLSFPNGIQKFDGKNFINVPVQPGLPDDKLVYFFKCRNGDLLISHSQGISKYEISSNKFRLVYTNRSREKTAAKFIGQDDPIIYFYARNGIITGIDASDFKIVSETKTGLPDYSSTSDYRPAFSNNIINHRITIQVKSILYLWDLQKGKLLYQSATIPDLSPYLLLMKSDSEVAYYTYAVSNALHFYNFPGNSSRTQIVKGKDDKIIYRCVIFPWRNKTLISFNNRVYETDTILHELTSELVNFQNKPFVSNTSIWGIREDNFGNLYLLTVTDGIRKMIGTNYPIKYYGAIEEKNNALFILPDKQNNCVLMGTVTGLMIFDTLQHLIKHIKTVPGNPLPLSPNVIIRNNQSNYILFNRNDNRVWELAHDFSKMKPVASYNSVPGGKFEIEYFGNFLFRNKEEAISQSQGWIYKTNFAANTVVQHEFTTSYTLSGLWYNGGIISHSNDELIFLDGATFKELKKIPFENTGGVRCFAKDAAGNIYIGSNKGIFIIDGKGKILMHLKKENGLPDECIYAMTFDKEGILWCSTNKGIFKLNKDNSILQLKKEDGLQENEFNTNVVAQAEDGELYFGGVNGVSSFYPAAISSQEEKMQLLVTQIKVNNEEAFADTAAWAIERIELPYNQNSLSFDFIAMATNNPGQYIYQYRMDGIDKTWIQNNDLQTVRYFLPPGSYDLKLYASRFFDKDAKPMKVISILIKPPFWKTWWFFTAIAGILVAALAYTINRYNKKKYQKKLSELATEHKVQLERERISRDLHDSIGAYANAVLYNTELLEKEDEEKLRQVLMKDVKFASKDIITALRETIWALKKDNYNAEDCLVRIRNFILPLSRYYQHIQFKIEGEAPAQKKLHYTKALNAVRIVQEAVTNAIKHAGAKNITIINEYNDDQWNLSVLDDGKGFEYENTASSEQGNGLNNMKKRAADSGFDLHIGFVQGKGTILNLGIS
jgi:signal transduction histidine kinase